MAFNQVGTYLTNGAPVIVREILANSIVVTTNDSVKLASGFVALGTTGALVFGHVISVGTSKGMGLNSTGVAGAEFGSFVNTYTLASDNQTVGKVKADVDVSKMTIYSGELDAAIGSTTGSNLNGYFTDLTDEDTLDESATVATTMQYALGGVDQRNTAQALCHIFESQVFGV